MKQVVKSGFLKARDVFIDLIKIIIPVYVLVTFLKYTGFIDLVAGIFSPMMQVVGLPGEAVVALLTAYLLNIYGGIAVISGLELGPREITILGTMIGIAHSLIIESAIFKKTKDKPIFD